MKFLKLSSDQAGAGAPSMLIPFRSLRREEYRLFICSDHKIKIRKDPMSIPRKVDSKGKHSDRLNHAPSRDHKLISKEVTTTTTNNFQQVQCHLKGSVQRLPTCFLTRPNIPAISATIQRLKEISMKTTFHNIITFYTLAEKMGSLGNLNMISDTCRKYE